MKILKLWCDTCEGVGFIDEALGGLSTSKEVQCRTCCGQGWFGYPVKDPFEDDKELEIIASSLSAEEFRGYCEGYSLHSLLNTSAKESVENKLTGIEKYRAAFKKYKLLCKDYTTGSI